MKSKRKLQIVVIGDSREIKKNNEIAYQLGRYIGENGWVLVTGGRGGVMENSARGASEAGGQVISVLPGIGIDEGNPYAEIKIPTGVGWARNSINVLCGDLVLAVGGGAGTLSELAYAWTFKKPIIACAWAEGWSHELAGQAIDTTRQDVILSANNLAELKDKITETVDMLRGA